MFPKSARLKAASPAARRKAVATLKATLARKKRMLDKGKTTVFQISDLPSERAPKIIKKKYQPRTTANSDRIQLAQEIVALLSKVLG